MTDYVDAILRDRLENPADDMLTEIANSEIDGQDVAWDLKVGYVRLLILAGVDNDDMLWQTASEEVLRYYAPVTMARKVINDTEVAGCPVHSGDQMLLTFPAANHDPAAFDAPDEFQLDRAKNRHVAFGLGIHRCVGSNPRPTRVAHCPPRVGASVPELRARRVQGNHVGQRPNPWTS